jgi:hypothetical protein
MNIDNKTLEHLKDIFDAHNDLTIEDITVLNVNRDTLVRYFSAYRLALCVEKIHDIGQDKELSAQINLLSGLINEIGGWIDGLQKSYLKKMASKKSSMDE